MKKKLKKIGSIDPVPSQKLIDQCEQNVQRMLSDKDFRENILSSVAHHLNLSSMDEFQDITIVTPETIRFQVVRIKLSNSYQKINFNDLKDDNISQLGRAICLPVNESYCPLIIQYDDSDTTINHEAIHLYQSLKPSFFPFDDQLTKIDRESYTPSIAVNKILKTYGVKRAIEYAVKNPSVILRKEAEAWCKVEKDYDKYIVGYCLLSLSKFVCAITNDIKLSPDDNRVTDSINSVVKFIEIIGKRDRYCKKITKNTNKNTRNNYTFGELISIGVGAYTETETSNLKGTIQMMMAACF